MSARLAVIEAHQVWRAAVLAEPEEKRAPDWRGQLRRRFEDFLDDLLAAHFLDGVDVDMVTWAELLDALDDM